MLRCRWSRTEAEGRAPHYIERTAWKATRYLPEQDQETLRGTYQHQRQEAGNRREREGGDIKFEESDQDVINE